MRKLSVILCLTFVTITAGAQLFRKEWIEGRYYDLDGKVHSGLIAWSPPAISIFKGEGDHIFFKSNPTADQEKIENTKISSFVINGDSLLSSTSLLVVKSPFLKLLVGKNESKLYGADVIYNSGGAMSMNGSGMMVMTGGPSSIRQTIYFYGKDQNNISKINRKNFKEAMSSILADFPELVERIQDENLDKSDMEDVLVYYKKRNAPPARMSAEKIKAAAKSATYYEQ